MSEQSEPADPEFIVEDVDDLKELLTRAGNWAEDDAEAEVIAAEFRQARDFVADELADEPELVTDGGVDQSEAEIDRRSVKLVKSQHWRYEDTDYVLGYMPTECEKCGDQIPDEHAGYIVDGPRSPGDGHLGELCFDCGGEVTGFGD